MREAEYLMGFVRFLPDEAYTQATRLKLVQVLSGQLGGPIADAFHGLDSGAVGVCLEDRGARDWRDLTCERLPIARQRVEVNGQEALRDRSSAA